MNSELEVFAGDLVEMLETRKFSPNEKEVIEDLLILARKCAVMSAADFTLQCEVIVQEVDDKRQELPMGVLKQLHTRILFTLTRCTRLLQFQKESVLDEGGLLHRLPMKSTEVPTLDRAWISSEHAKQVMSDRGPVPKVRSHIPDNDRKGPQGSEYETGHVQGRGDTTGAHELPSWRSSAGLSGTSESSLTPPNFVASGAEKVQSFLAGSHWRVDTKAKASSEVVSSSTNQLQVSKASTTSRHRVAWGQGGEQPKPPDVKVICRICETEVPSVRLEEHSRICAYADRCDQTSFSTDDRLLMLAELLERLSDMQSTSSLQHVSDAAKIHHHEPPEFCNDALAFHDKGVKNMEDLHGTPRAFDEFEQPGAWPRPRSEQGSSASNSPLVTPVASHMDLSMSEQVHDVDSEEVMEVGQFFGLQYFTNGEVLMN